MSDETSVRPAVDAVGEDDVRGIRHDPDALERFYRRHFDDVVSYMSRRCSNPHDVSDLVAEAFVQAIDSAETFDPRRGRPIAWLMGICRNTYRHHVRDTAARRHLERRIEGRRLLDADDVSRLEDVIDAQRRAQRLLGRLDVLTDRERELLELVDLAGLYPVEAARALRITPATARVRLHRARTRLKSLEDHDG